jgi:hypothetical protein
MKNSKRKILVPTPMVEVKGVCLKCAARGVCGIIMSLKQGGTMASCTRFVPKPHRQPRQKVVKVEGFVTKDSFSKDREDRESNRYSDHN